MRLISPRRRAVLAEEATLPPLYMRGRNENRPFSEELMDQDGYHAPHGEDPDSVHVEDWLPACH